MELSNAHDDEEHSRIEKLESYEIMDSEPEVSFDQLAYLASTVCETPIALISFIDSNRQWFKSSVGIELHEIPRHLSACNQTIKHHYPYMIPDMSEDTSEYKDFMEKEGFAFYAGVPISAENGENMGTLCVIDYEPKVLDEEQLTTLKVIADQIVDLLEVRKKYRENLKRMKSLGDSNLQTEKRIQEYAHKAAIRGMAELSAGLSYRLKPHLMAIKAVESQLEKSVPSEMETGKQFKILNDSAAEMLHILDSLEKFVLAEKERSMKLMDLGEAIKMVLTHLEYKIRKYDIDLSCNIERELRCIGNISQIKEVLFCVIDNAIDAVINMKTRKIELHVKEDNHKISIHIIDSGKGISDSIKPFIFQPFFTTKGPQSLGIGLSLSQSLLQRHSGEIKLLKSSGPTTFCIMLPSP